MPDKPKRPWRSFSDYRIFVTTGLPAIRDNPRAWPCTKCKGQKRVVDPETLGIYETKAEYLRCPRCEATGLGNREEHQDIYHHAISTYLSEKRTYEARLKHFKAAKAKLLPAEIAALKFFGLKK